MVKAQRSLSGYLRATTDSLETAIVGDSESGSRPLSFLVILAATAYS